MIMVVEDLKIIEKQIMAIPTPVNAPVYSKGTNNR
jgi:hypothetical protein